MRRYLSIPRSNCRPSHRSCERRRQWPSCQRYLHLLASASRVRCLASQQHDEHLDARRWMDVTTTLSCLTGRSRASSFSR